MPTKAETELVALRKLEDERYVMPCLEVEERARKIATALRKLNSSDFRTRARFDKTPASELARELRDLIDDASETPRGLEVARMAQERQDRMGELGYTGQRARIFFGFYLTGARLGIAAKNLGLIYVPFSTFRWRKDKTDEDKQITRAIFREAAKFPGRTGRVPDGGPYGAAMRRGYEEARDGRAPEWVIAQASS